MVTVSNLHIPSIWYVIEDRPEILHSIYSVDFLQVSFVFLSGCSRDSFVEPEGPWCLQRNTGALLFLDRVNGLLRQDRCLQQVRRKRSTLLRFAFCRGHVRNDDAAGSSAVTSKSCDRRRADAAVTVDVVTSCVTSRRRSPLQVLQLILIRESSFDDLRHEREIVYK